MAWEPVEQDKSKRIAAWIVRFMQAVSILCFLGGGGLAAKDYAPMAMKAIKQAMQSDATDPMALYKLEREKQKALEADKAKSRAATANMAGDGSGYDSNDDPYAYIAGGKAAKKGQDGQKGQNGQDEDGFSSQDSAAAASSNGLWEKGKMGNANFANSPTSGGLGSASGSGASMGAGASGQGDTKGLRGVQGGSSASMMASAAGSGAGGTVARGKKQSVKTGQRASAIQGGAMSQLRKAGGKNSVERFNAHSKGENVSQYQAGQMDQLLAGKTNSNILQTGGAGEVGGLVSSEDISSQIDNPNSKNNLIKPENTQRSENYDSELNALAALGAAIAALGLILAATAKKANTNLISGSAWSLGWWAGMVMIAVFLGMALDLKGKSEIAATLASTFIESAITLTAGYLGMVIFGVEGFLGHTLVGGTFVGNAMQHVKQLLGGGQKK